MDINPRALRFARFNAQLNGIHHVTFVLGDVCNLDARLGMFDLILANPPFVPTPVQALQFRDGGARGEDILQQIVSLAPRLLGADGRLCIVSDLVDIPGYEQKLRQWWGGAGKCLLLTTADRNEILFALPHCKQPFDQSYDEFCEELAKWVAHYRSVGMVGVNFGFILMQKQSTGNFTYYTKVIHTPSSVIADEAWQHFERLTAMSTLAETTLLRVHPAIRLRCDTGSAGQRRYAVVSSHAYFSEYEISPRVYALLSRMLTDDIALSAVASADRDALATLLEKGIVISAPSDAASRPRATGDSGTALTVSIQEYATKTTPTCLSSYLKQA